MAYFPGLKSSYTPLSKIPIVIATNILAAFTLTPRRPPAPTGGEAKYGNRGDPMGYSSIRWLIVPIYNGIYWTNAVAETLAILCTQYPSSIGDTILTLITRRPKTAGNIRFTRVWLVGAGMIMVGSLIRLACFRALGRFFTFELSLEKDQHLITNGPYSIVRHPSYVGAWLVSVGTIFMHLGPGGWMHECVWGIRLGNGVMAMWGALRIVVPVLLTIRVSREDEVLRKAFGGEWEAYARRTPYRLIPFLY